MKKKKGKYQFEEYLRKQVIEQRSIQPLFQVTIIVTKLNNKIIILNQILCQNSKFTDGQG